MHRIESELKHRILILDGALGTITQDYGFSESDFRTKRLVNHNTELKGNTEILNLSQPDIIENIHLQYLEAGADIITTNTFGANSISQADYGLSEWVYKINFAGAQLGLNAIKKYRINNGTKPIFLAGAIGPTTKLASLSPDVNDPGFRSVGFDQLVSAYTEQANALIDGGVDLFLLETITDTLNAKAAIFGLMELFAKLGREFPIMISGTITDASGRILSGQTLEAFLISISHAPLISVGLNCALGSRELIPYVRELHERCPFYVSAHPNAGLPNQFGDYDQSPEEFAQLIHQFAQEKWVNIVGGCCGTTPEHIRMAYLAVKDIVPRRGKSNLTSGLRQGTPPFIIDKINNWTTSTSKPTFELKELMSIVSYIDDKESFMRLKNKFDAERNKYHSEQALLLNAHIYGRYQYLRTEIGQP